MKPKTLNKLYIFVFSLIVILYSIFYREGRLDGNQAFFRFICICCIFFTVTLIFTFSKKIPTVYKEDGFSIIVDKKTNSVYIANTKDDPVCGVTVTPSKTEPGGYLYVVGFSEDEKNVYALDPKTGRGVKVFGYSSKDVKIDRDEPD